MRKNLFIYSGAAVAISGFSFLSVTVLTYMLSKTDFGIVENFTALFSLFTVFIMWGSSVPLVNYYSEKDEKQEFVNAFRGILVQTCLFLFLASFYIYDFFAIDRTLLFLIIIFSSISSFSSIFLTALQLEKQALKYACFTSISAFLSAALGIVWVYYSGSVYGRILAPIVIAFLILLVLFYDFDNKKMTSCFSFLVSIKEFYRIGLPIAVGLVLSWGLEKIDRFMISDMISVEDLGVYGVGYKFGMVVLFIQCAVSKTWLPFLVENSANRKQVKKTILKISGFLLILTFFSSIASYFYVQLFIDEKFAAAGLIAVIVSFGYCLDGIWKLFNGILIFENKYKFYTLLVGIAGICNVLINYFAIPRWGIMGAALATLFAFAVGMICNWYYVRFRLNWFEGHSGEKLV